MTDEEKVAFILETLTKEHISPDVKMRWLKDFLFFEGSEWDELQH